MTPDNPFYVLELEPDAEPKAIERQGRKLLALVEVGAKKTTYTCPQGTFPRDATAIREAIAALRDPKRRAVAASLVRLAAVDPARRAEAAELLRTRADAPLEDAFPRAGFEGL